MGYDRDTTARVRRLLAPQGDVVEKRMVGGVSFNVHGHMCCGVTSTGLMVRLGPGAVARALEEPHVRPMHMGGKRLSAFVLIDPEGYSDDPALAGWVRRALEFVSRLS